MKDHTKYKDFSVVCHAYFQDAIDAHVQEFIILMTSPSPVDSVNQYTSWCCYSIVLPFDTSVNQAEGVDGSQAVKLSVRLIEALCQAGRAAEKVWLDSSMNESSWHAVQAMLQQIQPVTAQKN